MKVEGMDAAGRAAAVAATAYPIEQPHGSSGSVSAPGAVKPKLPENGDQAGISGNVAKKVRLASEAPAYDKALAQQEEGRDETEKVVREAIERANRVLSGSDRKFEISIHEKTKDVMVKVVDTNTNETIREIPPKKIVDLVVRLCEIAGILFDAKG